MTRQQKDHERYILYIGKVRATGYAVSKYRYQVTLYQDSLRDIEAMRY
jgi:hypothetical protein